METSDILAIVGIISFLLIAFLGLCCLISDAPGFHEEQSCIIVTNRSDCYNQVEPVFLHHEVRQYCHSYLVCGNNTTDLGYMRKEG